MPFLGDIDFSKIIRENVPIEMSFESTQNKHVIHIFLFALHSVGNSATPEHLGR